MDSKLKLLIDSLKLNPKFISDSLLYADHCIVERITKDDKYDMPNYSYVKKGE